MQQKTVFISYRRKISKHLARSIYQDLKMNDWDVFLDVNTIDSGDFDKIILNQIGARAHFILLISKGSLERCANTGDWVLREIKEAVRLHRNIVPIIEEDADFTQETSYLPDELRSIIAKKNALPLTHFFFDPAMEMLRKRFLKTPEYVKIQQTPSEEQAEVERRIEQAEAEELPQQLPLYASGITKASSLNLMPKPFEWIEIPNKDYSIAKYPITNAQFAIFIDAGGYQKTKWWTNQGWEACQIGWQFDGQWKSLGNPWTVPRFWNDNKWNGDTQPVVGISWYEAIAFCLWISDITGEKISLPTEIQWQYASQGDSGRKYPWGNEWDCNCCNNRVIPCTSDGTSSVTQFRGKGDSPFGVVDMVGNVWEWCSTDSITKTNNIHVDTKNRMLKGGSWRNSTLNMLQCDNYADPMPRDRDNYFGFRIVRNNS